MRGEVHILVYCPIDTFQWGSTHSALVVCLRLELLLFKFCTFSDWTLFLRGRDTFEIIDLHGD